MVQKWAVTVKFFAISMVFFCNAYADTNQSYKFIQAGSFSNIDLFAIKNTNRKQQTLPACFESRLFYSDSFITDSELIFRAIYNKMNIIADCFIGNEVKKEVFKGKDVLSKNGKMDKKHNLMFICMSILFILANLALMLHYRVRKKAEDVYQEKILLQTKLEERNRISREMHDDLGTSLTSVNMSIELLKRNPDDLSKLSRLQNEILQMHSQMNVIIWRLNMRNDTLPNLVLFIRRFAEKFLADAGMKIVFESINIPNISIESKTRHGVYMIIKEILNNIVKHSKANNVQLQFEVFLDTLRISIQEDGIGFDPNSTLYNGGNGLLNLSENVANLGGSIQWRFADNLLVEILIPL
ncbi:MAG: histidine kinase [Chitinophagaceae bacterium]|jgi:signal transduction histidine kinase